ncbi:MAG TPA: RNA polymerase sigma factor [Bacteroidia bacterium]|mgnify:CR=1 FL=1|nr:RNA polymerase sigma factor [Bacteroidia bacterium]HRS58228.1 RNA polymerase sigma factor [Bacteroidia bacterium]HRU68651.1 RNA polymerase sigma factor [Bacteroidia bacterium]
MTVTEYNKSVDDYSDGIYRFIVKNIGDSDKAKDIVQDTFMKLWQKIDEVNGEKVKSYLFTTAYHTMIDYIRKDNRITGLEQADYSGHKTSETYSDTMEIINAAVKRLPEIQRTVILLRDYEGYSYNDIAEVTGLNESQVKVYIYRARVALKEYLKSADLVI